MLSTMFWIAVGAFLGWNLPQPSWAASAQEKIVVWTKGLIGK